MHFNTAVFIFLVTNFVVFSCAQIIENDSKSAFNLYQDNKAKKIKYHIELDKNIRQYNKLFPENPFFQLETPESYIFQSIDSGIIPQTDINQENSEVISNTEETNSNNPFFQNLFHQTTTENSNFYATDDDNLIFPQDYEQTESNYDYEENYDNNVIIHSNNPFLQGFVNNNNNIETSTSSNNITPNDEMNTEEDKNDDNILIHKDNPFLQEFFQQESTSKKNIITTTETITTSTSTTTENPIEIEPETEAIITEKNDPITTTTLKPFTTTPTTTNAPKPTPVMSLTTPIIFTNTQIIKQEKNEKKRLFLSPTIEETLLRKELEMVYPDMLRFKPITNEFEDPDFIEFYLQSLYE